MVGVKMDGTLKVVLISAAVSGAMLLVVFLYVRSLIPQEVIDNWGDIQKHMQDAKWFSAKIEQMQAHAKWWGWTT